MRARPMVVCFAAALAALSAFSGAARAGAWLPVPGEYYSEFAAARSVADTYYDDARGRSALPDGKVQEIRDLRSYNELGWKPWASIVLAVPLRSLTEQFGATKGFRERTETGFADLDIGVRFKIWEGATAIALQADWMPPLGYQDGEDPMLGTGRQTAQGAVLVGKSLPGFNAFVEADGGYRTEVVKDGASGLFGSATAGWWIGSSVLISGRYAATMTTTAFQDGPDENVQTVNPQLLYRVDDRLDVFFGSVHTATGRNALHHDAVYVGMAFKQTRLNRLQGFLGGKRRS